MIAIASANRYYTAGIYLSNMRVRYWRLGITDFLSANYPPEKANHWEIKCMQGEYEHFGVFWYRYGTPFDKEPVHGICFYHNDIPKKTVEELTSFLHGKFGGEVLYRQSRVFLQGSKEFADPKSVGVLANDLSLKFNAPVELNVEFEKITKEEVDSEVFKLPASKALPIVGPD
jgi:hypothetical protein